MWGGVEERRVCQNRRAGVCVMPRPTILTQAALAHVTSLVDQALSAAEIATEIGCTLGTLRVRCSQLVISLRQRATGSRKDAAAVMDLVPPPQASAVLRHEFFARVRTVEQSPTVVS